MTLSARGFQLSALPRHPDIALAAFVAALIATMILPLPSGLLDVLLAVNLSASAVVLVAVLLSPRPLSLSTFPTLLLITTLFRLALNVSTTRLILSTGDAGEVVRAFGQFVLRGDLVVGVVIFLVITVVQLLVIGKGAERVAEVGARFTLDAMPGKQMSIDAGLRSGALTEEEAQEARDELGRESQFYGAMDGAMKFIKGDAIAGLVITALNLIAGLSIGVLRHGLPLSEAARLYSVLTVGDGLVSQLPALLITLSAGVLSTRVASRAPGSGLAENLQEELLSSPKVLSVGAGFSLCLGLIPGLPLLPFLGISALLSLSALSLSRAQARRLAASPSHTTLHALEQTMQSKLHKQRSLVDELPPSVPLLGVDLDPQLTLALGFGPGSKDDQTELIGSLIPQLRDAIYLESGVKLPGVRVRSNTPGLRPASCVLRLKDVPSVELQIAPELLLAVDTPQGLERLGVPCQPAQHPLSGGPAALFAPEHRALVDAAGVTIWTPSGVIALSLAKLARANLREFIGLNETHALLERMEEAYPALVKEVVPRAIGVPQLTEVLRRLVEEGVSVRDLRSILEALAEHAPFESSSVVLTELVRAALSSQLAHSHAGLTGGLSALLLDELIEDTVRSSIHESRGGSYLAMEPELRQQILQKIDAALHPALVAGVRPVLLTRADIRRYVKKLVEERLPQVAVLSYAELPAQLSVQPLGRVSMAEEGLALRGAGPIPRRWEGGRGAWTRPRAELSRSTLVYLSSQRAA